MRQAFRSEVVRALSIIDGPFPMHLDVRCEGMQQTFQPLLAWLRVNAYHNLKTLLDLEGSSSRTQNLNERPAKIPPDSTWGTP
ncbi:hypothetical protein HS088_TW22G00057 [Tripterygium wilfordii]|uniref:Uncharacterized protein n=1 Tax=Tripterygium wilfordii TaxID=458696 RepID=A0A7J7BWV8_TRIWF|nr:hypothetical protein HS088_TW22G00057 [Tripterygium wilfordii]